MLADEFEQECAEIMRSFEEAVAATAKRQAREQDEALFDEAYRAAAASREREGK